MTALRVAHLATVDSTLRFLLLPQMVYLRDHGYEVTAISRPGPWVADLEAAGIRHIGWAHATRAWRPSADARAFVELLGILRQERFDLLHTHNPKPGIMGRLAARLARIPNVVNTVHGLYATPEAPAARKTSVLSLEWLAARFSDLELFQSEEDLRWARRIRLVRPGRSLLLGNGVDLSLFDRAAVANGRREALRAGFGIPPSATVVGTVGRIVAEKGYREYIAAARAIRDSVPGTVFMAVGDRDRDKADSLPESEISDARSHVVFTGWRTDVRDLMGIMDVFVLASWREGVPRSAIEAAAMGLPLVLTDIRGCREVARDGVEGILVPPRDSNGLGDAIARLVAEPEVRVRMGAAARARAEERFDERQIHERIATCYRALTQGDGLVGRPESPTFT
jgi:glycosyltransferase involved in cell wall biosynthesis